MARKKKLLPRGFAELLVTGDLAALTAAYDSCLVEARDGRGGPTALGMYDCPPALMRWLVERGLDVDLPDEFGTTPLTRHVIVGNVAAIETLLDLGARVEGNDPEQDRPLTFAARFHQPESMRVLLDHGADPLAPTVTGDPVLESALQACANSDIVAMVEIASVLITAGAVVTESMGEAVGEIGRQFEFAREGFAVEALPATDAALARLYQIFGVAPVGRRRHHDGTSPITVTADSWDAQQEELWALLVPASGSAATVQGEVVRIAGRVAYEVHHNGAANWDADHRAMIDALSTHLRSGTPLAATELADLDQLLPVVRSARADAPELNRLTELSVRWVLLNPTPVRLGTTPYRR